jgi:hypothetical protein
MKMHVETMKMHVETMKMHVETMKMHVETMKNVEICFFLLKIIYSSILTFT